MKSGSSVKTCSKCKESVNVENFHKDKSRVSGLRSYCKSCDYAYAAYWRDKNIEKTREQAKIRYSKNPEKIKEKNREYKSKNVEKLKKYRKERYAREKLEKSLNCIDVQ